jgi:hypothetical protein
MAKRLRKKQGTPGSPPQTRKAIRPPKRAPETAVVETPLRWTLIPQVLIIVAAVFWIYWPALHGDWLWDDDYLISENTLVHDPEGIWDIWLNPSTLIDYFPLTVSLEWLEWQIWPNDTLCYHLTNVILHAASALLIWYLLTKLGLRFAWLGGLIFAIHPIMVESVAWMAELKNTLSMPPFLLAICAWIDFDRLGKWRYYCLALGLFVVAMLCKTSMVMFPVLILLYAWWKHDHIKLRDLQLAAPFFAISIIIGLTLIAFLRHGVGEETIPLGGLLSRLACGGLSLVFYFSKAVLPVDLSPIYPQWTVNPPAVWQFIPWVVFAAAAYWLWSKRQPWARGVLFAFAFFLINLAPFVGFHTISFMRFSWVMDHLLYLPIIGLLGLAVAALEKIDAQLDPVKRRCVMGLVAALAIIFTVGSHRYAKIYLNSEALWTYTIHQFPDAWPAHNDLGNALSNAHRLAAAEVQYQEALRINPGYPEAHNNLGIILAQTGRMPEAAAQFQEALRLCPDLQSAQDNLAKVQVWMSRGSNKK